MRVALVGVTEYSPAVFAGEMHHHLDLRLVPRTLTSAPSRGSIRRPRPRGARRPRRGASARSSAASGDSGDGDPPGPADAGKIGGGS